MKLFPIASYRWWLLGIAVLASMVWGGIYTVLQKTSCNLNDYSCVHFTEILAAFTWGFFLKSIIITSVLLMFFPERTFKWWRWFALVFIPLLIWGIMEPTDMGMLSRQGLGSDAGHFFLSLSITLAIYAVLYEKIQHCALNTRLYRYGTHFIALLFSLCIGTFIFWFFAVR